MLTHCVNTSNRAGLPDGLQGDRETCLGSGMDDYVTKPIRVDALVEALNQVKTRNAR
jgi:CheY-like chemotaxis protein